MFALPLHPALVHFPIAFYCLGVLLTLIYLRWREANYELFAYGLFCLSLTTSLIAALAGVIDQGDLAYDDPRQAALDNHVSTSIAFMVFNALVVYYRFRWTNILTDQHKWQYFLLMFGGLSCLVWTGHQGGTLVYHLLIGIK